MTKTKPAIPAKRTESSVVTCPRCPREFDLSDQSGKMSLIGHAWQAHQMRVNGKGEEITTGIPQRQKAKKSSKKSSKKFQCQHCSESFSDQHAYAGHQKAHREETPSGVKVPCTECGKVCKNAHSMAVHRYRAHHYRSKSTVIPSQIPTTVVDKETLGLLLTADDRELSALSKAELKHSIGLLVGRVKELEKELEARPHGIPMAEDLHRCPSCGYEIRDLNETMVTIEAARKAGKNLKVTY